jgi:hypothetical protein
MRLYKGWRGRDGENARLTLLLRPRSAKDRIERLRYRHMVKRRPLPQQLARLDVNLLHRAVESPTFSRSSDGGEVDLPWSPVFDDGGVVRGDGELRSKSVGWREKERKEKWSNVMRVSRVCCSRSLRLYRRDKLVVLIVDLPLSVSVTGKLLRSFMCGRSAETEKEENSKRRTSVER